MYFTIYSLIFTSMLTGTKIKKIRELKNLKQEFIANELGITQQQYSEIERNNVDIKESRLRDIAKILEVKPEDILTFDETRIFNIYENKQVNGTLIQHGIDKDSLDVLLNQQKQHIEDIIKLKDSEIEYLKSIVDKYLNKE